MTTRVRPRSQTSPDRVGTTPDGTPTGAPDDQARPPNLSRVALVLLAAVGLIEITAVVVGAWMGDLSASEVIDSYTLTNVAFGVGFGGCGFLLALRRPRNPIGWLFLAGALAHLTTAAVAAWIPRGLDAGWPVGVLRLMTTVFSVAWPFGIGLAFPVALLLFPTGRPLSRRWGLWTWVVAASGIVFVLQQGTGTEEILPGAGVSYLAPLTIPEPLWSVVTIINAMITFTVALALVDRYRRAHETQRRQLLWLLLGVIAAFALNAQRWLTDDGPILLLLTFQLIPVAVLIAILRHQLLDIRLVVSRTVAYLALTVVVLAAYAGVVSLLNELVRERAGELGISGIAALAIALAFNPLRVRVQALGDRLFYGDRRDPARAMSRVGDRLAEGTGDLEAVLDALRETLRLPGVRVQSQGVVAATSGEQSTRTHVVPLRFGGDTIGELVVSVRTGQQRLSAADLRTLELVGVPLAVALRATALATQLAQARGRVVAAREEERRRLRRDLHDGLGSRLTGAAYLADAVRNDVAAEPARAAARADDLRDEIAGAIDDIRRLVEGLRPPALDELGLVSALRNQATRFAQRPDGRPLRVTVQGPDDLSALPAAVEVAAYRIATEALTNVARHSTATSAVVRLERGADLLVEVVDDGQPTGAYESGFGLSTMAERAAELGGTCTAGPASNGWSVRARLPLG